MSVLQNKKIKFLDQYLGRFTALVFFVTIIYSFLGNEVSGFLIGFNFLLATLFLTLHAMAEGLGFYILRRIGQAFVTLWLIASLTFILLRVIPGGPFDQEKALPPEVKAAIEAKYNLNASMAEQYFDYMKGIATGDFGFSYKYTGRTVYEILSEGFPASFELGIYSLVLSFLIGIPAGVFAASKHNTWKDTLTMVFAISSVSIPSFLVAAILITIFCFWFDILPVALWEGPEYYILPVMVLGMRPAAIIARLTRAGVLDVMQSDYIRTARAKGLPERVVMFKHALKNSLIPVLTFAGPLAAGVLSGAFIVEYIFNIPGIGKHFVQSVTNRDYPLVLGVTLISSFLLVICNLIVDLLYTYFDPRIKLT